MHSVANVGEQRALGKELCYLNLNLVSPTTNSLCGACLGEESGTGNGLRFSL